MNLQCDIDAAKSYTSPSQIARVLSERWLLQNMYCLNCESSALQQSKPNSHCLDFTCRACRQRYELKAFLQRPRTSLVDGAYRSMMATIEAGTTPALFLMRRDMGWRVHDLSVIHPAFLTASIIDKRKPLAAAARRAGWVGCNIRLDRLASEAEIPVITQGVASDPHVTRNHFRRLSPVQSLSANERGWAGLTLLAIERLVEADSFTLGDLYRMEPLFASRYPGNRHIRAKIRQQLQRLRDLGLIRFLGSGHYSSVQHSRAED